MQIIGRPEPNIKINFLNSVELERSVSSMGQNQTFSTEPTLVLKYYSFTLSRTWNFHLEADCPSASTATFRVAILFPLGDPGGAARQTR